MLWGVPYALLAVLGAVPLILFLHSRRPGGLRVRTTTLFIWERVLAERPLATRLGWFVRKNLLLILQLAAAILLIAALADPLLTSFGSRAGDTVVVMDLTASMKAKGPAGTRFEAARRELLSLVDALPAERKMMVIGAGSETRLIVPFTADRKRLREAARDLAPADTSGNVKDAVLLAHSFLKKGGRDRVVLVSDGAFAGAEEFNRDSAHLRFIRTAGGAANLGIVGLSLRRAADGSGHHEVMAHVRNFGASAARAPFTLALGQTSLAREELTIEAGGRRILVYPYRRGSRRHAHRAARYRRRSRHRQSRHAHDERGGAAQAALRRSRQSGVEQPAQGLSQRASSRRSRPGRPTRHRARASARAATTP